MTAGGSKPGADTIFLPFVARVAGGKGAKIAGEHKPNGNAPVDQRGRAGVQ